MEANRGTLWMPGASNGALAVLKAPNLVAIPYALVNLLRTQGPAITPHDVLVTIDDDNFVHTSGQPAGQQLECVHKWCLAAGQAGTNGKIKVFLGTSSVTIDYKDFNRWVGNQLDMTCRPRPSAAAVPLAGTAGNQQAFDYLALSKMPAITIGANMMQFSQAITPRVGAVGATAAKTALATRKGFNQDQIAKQKDACGIRNAQQIPPIWSVIQATKGKSFDT